MMARSFFKSLQKLAFDFPLFPLILFYLCERNLFNNHFQISKQICLKGGAEVTLNF